MNLRIQKASKEMCGRGLDAFLVSSGTNISYLTGLNVSDAWLLVGKKTVYFLTDFRYREELKKKLPPVFKLHIIKKSLSCDLFDLCRKERFFSLGFEEKHISYFLFKGLKAKAGLKTRLFPQSGLVEDLRAVKEAKEIEAIERATKIALLAFRHARSILVPGITENEVVLSLESFLRENGAEGPAFDIICASGVHSAYPHAKPTDKKIRLGEPVLIDLGAQVRGYKSDLTRTVFLGKINASYRKVYSIVEQAQKDAISHIKIGNEASNIDRAARGYIHKRGYGDFFGHSLGHGIGLETHESPFINSKNPIKIRENMVFTVEPGIYLPGRFGVRIEDIVLARKKGNRILSGSDHSGD